MICSVHGELGEILCMHACFRFRIYIFTNATWWYLHSVQTWMRVCACICFSCTHEYVIKQLDSVIRVLWEFVCIFAFPAFTQIYTAIWWHVLVTRNRVRVCVSICFSCIHVNASLCRSMISTVFPSFRQHDSDWSLRILYMLLSCCCWHCVRILYMLLSCCCWHCVSKGHKMSFFWSWYVQSERLRP